MEFIKLIKILGDETRIRILNILRKQELCVCEIEHILGLTQSNASRHLNKLSLLGVIKSEKKAQWVYYSLNKMLLEEHKFLRLILDEEMDKDEKLREDIRKYVEYKNSGMGCSDLK